MLLQVLVVAVLSHMTEATFSPQTLNISQCHLDAAKTNYTTLYVSEYSGGLYLCTHRFKDGGSNVCVWTPGVTVDSVDLNISQTTDTLFHNLTSVPIGGDSPCENILRFSSAGTVVITLSLRTYGGHGFVTVTSAVTNSTLIFEAGPHGTVFRSVNFGSGKANPLLLCGCTDGDGKNVNNDVLFCKNNKLWLCDNSFREVLKKECPSICKNKQCTSHCAVLAQSILSILSPNGSLIPDRCSYILLNNTDMELVAVFKERRRIKVPLLDHLRLRAGTTQIQLGPGTGLLQVNGSAVNISSSPSLPTGLNVSKTQTGMTLLYQSNFELNFEGYSAVIDIQNSTGLMGLCMNNTDLAAYKSSFSEIGCDKNYTEDSLSINCTEKTEHCNLLKASPFTACHNSTQPDAFIEACKDTLCNYPSVDGLDCAFHQAYASSCSMLNISVQGWRNSTTCGSAVGLCTDTYCSDHEFCGFEMNKEMCLCRSLFVYKQVQSNNTLGEVTVCDQNSASISLPVCLLDKKGIRHNELHLNHANCTGQLDEETHMLNFSFNSDKMCGTEVTRENEQLIFKNKILLPNDTTSLITRNDKFQVNFSCYYSDPEVKTVGFKIKDSSVLQTIVSGLWSYNLTMKAYNNPARTTLAESALELGDPIWVVLSAVGLDEKLITIVTDDCWATSQQMANSTPRYNLVSNGCPSNDSTVQVHGNGVGISNYFNFNIFQFTGSSSDVYLHCEVSLCVSNCVKTCGIARRRRSLKKDPNRTLISMSWSN